jgi:hypothetical protein
MEQKEFKRMMHIKHLMFDTTMKMHSGKEKIGFYEGYLQRLREEYEEASDEYKKSLDKKEEEVLDTIVKEAQ